MNNHKAKLAGLLSLALTLAFFSPQQAAADDNDPPGRVARLAYERGSVSFEPGGTDEWVAARVNRPMTTGDKLWTDAGALAEMNTGSAYIRIGSNTGFSFLNLSDYATQIQLTEGTLLVRVRRLDQNETFEIDTPNLAFSVYQSGAYKVTVNEAGDVTVVQVRQGEGEVTGGGAAYTLHEGEEGRFAGTDGLEANMSSYRHRSDDFENWSSGRDRRIDHSYSSRYVSPDVIGYEDLDEHGGWRSSGEYGNVWFPHTTEVGWAPYHNGHWAYIAPWGYTWVDDEPWGFAPFHYGRWVNVEGAWGWVPGRRESDYGGGEAYVRPVYAPALVAWVGGAHFAIGVSVGGGGGYSEGQSVGWFPLGPREVYVPSYPVSRNYVNNVNVSNTTVTNTVVNNYYNTTVVNNTNNSTNVNVTNVKYVNQAVPGAVAATTPQAFVSAQPVARNIVQVNQREIATAPVRIAAPPVAPSREAVLGTTVRASIKPPEAVVNRTVVAKVAPPAPPVPFVQQQKAIEANGGKPLAGAEIHQMQVKEQQQVQRAPQPQHTQPGQQPQALPQVQQTPQQAIRIAPPAQPQTARPAQAQANPGNPPAATPNNQPQQNNRPANQNTQQQPTQPQQQPANPMGQPATITPNRPNAANNQPNRPNNQPPPARPANTPDPALEQKHQQELEQLHKQQDQQRQRVEQQQQQDRKAQEQKVADQQRQQQQQQAQRNADQQQQQDRKAQEQKAADQQRQQQAQRNADQQQQQDRKVQLQKVADQQLQQQQQQAQRNADQQQQAQRNADQQRQQQAQKTADLQRQQLDQKHQQELIQLEQKHAQEQQQLNQKHAQEHQQQARPQPPPPPQQRPQQQSPPPPPQKDKAKPKTDRPPQDRPPQRG